MHAHIITDGWKYQFNPGCDSKKQKADTLRNSVDVIFI